MRRTRNLALLLAMVVSTVACAAQKDTREAQARPQAAGSIVPGELLVRFIDGLEPRQIQQVLRREDATLIAHLDSIGIHHVRLPDGVDTLEAAQRWSALAEVEYAEPNRHRPRP